MESGLSNALNFLTAGCLIWVRYGPRGLPSLLTVPPVPITPLWCDHMLPVRRDGLHLIFGPENGSVETSIEYLTDPRKGAEIRLGSDVFIGSPPTFSRKLTGNKAVVIISKSVVSDRTTGIECRISNSLRCPMSCEIFGECAY